MKVIIKSFKIEMEVKKQGVELEIKSPDGSEHHGDCYVTMTGLTWCSGRTTKANGLKLKWEELMKICESQESKKAALSAVKKL